MTAVTRNQLKARHPSIEWQPMAAAGNIYRHKYEDVAARRVWRTLTGGFAPLLAVVEAELAELGRSGAFAPRWR